MYVNPRGPSLVAVEEEGEKELAEESDSEPNIMKWKFKLQNILIHSRDNELYHNFLEGEVSLSFFLIISMIATVVTLVMIIVNAQLSITLQIILAQRIVIPISFWVYLGVIYTKRVRGRNAFPFHNAFVGDFVVLCYAISFGAYLISAATLLGECDDESTRRVLFCDGHISAGKIVPYAIIMTGLPFLAKCRHLEAVLFAVAIEVGVLLYVGARVRIDVEHCTALVAVILVQVSSFIDAETFSRRMYLTNKHLKSTYRVMLNARDLTADANGKTTELRHMIGNVAHDLKTPLQAFTYELDTIRSYTKSPPENASSTCKRVADSVEILSGISSFMVMTINRTLDYSKVNSGIALRASLETVNLPSALDWVGSTMRQSNTDMAGLVPLVIDSPPPEACECIITDRQWLLENLLCLASNSRKFSFHGEITIKCKLQMPKSDEKSNEVSWPRCIEDQLPSARSCCSQNMIDFKTMREDVPMLLFEVEDSGIGIPEEDIACMFKSVMESGKHAGGTGLGLFSLAKRVECLGGSCGVSDRSDGAAGSRFWFCIPYRPDATALNQANSGSVTTSDSRRSPGNESSGNESKDNSKSNSQSVGAGAGGDTPVSERAQWEGEPRILLVDDSTLIQKTSFRAFQREGIPLTLACNGVDCLDKVRAGNFELILMDMQMPVMDGIEATKRLREREKEEKEKEGGSDDIESGGRKRLIIVGLSANSDMESKQEALAAGMDAFVAKPLELAPLKVILRNLGCDAL